MHPEQCTAIRDFICPQLADESKTTHRIIKAIPAHRAFYTPDPKSMTALDLAWHIPAVELFLLRGVLDLKLDFDSLKRPEELKTPEDILRWYDERFPAALDQVRALPGEHLATMIPFQLGDMPAVLYLNFMLKHTVHHRGQLSAYLRPMGAKVPSIYGPSADSGMEQNAAQA